MNDRIPEQIAKVIEQIVEQKNFPVKLQRRTPKKLVKIIIKQIPMNIQSRMVVGAGLWYASFVLMSVDTLCQCFGILFSNFLLEQVASSLTTAWVVNLFNFFFCLTGLPLGPLINEFGWRKITFTASFLLFIATVSSAFATSVWILYFTYSILAGISCGMLLIVGYTIVPHYFSCRRGLASGIIMALDSGGQIVAPPLLNFLQEEYTFRGATLILGGIILNCCVAAAVFHPVEWHSKSAVSKSGRKDHTETATDEECIDNERGHSVHKDKMFIHLLLSMVNNLKILRSLRAIIIALGTTFFLCGFLNFMAFLPFFMQEQGFSLGDAALCISVSAVCNTLTRFLVAFLTDYSWFNYRISLMFSCATLTVVMIVFSQLQTLPWMIATMCFYGISVGSYMCLFNLVMVHYMGLENLMAMMGTTMMCISLGNLFIGPLAGFARDVSGSYIVCIWFLSGLIFISFLLWFSMSFAVKYDKKRETNDTL